MPATRPRKSSSAGTLVRLRPADPFDLIRWLARSQADPRKAIAELVQNSLDAGATHVTIDRRRLHGSPSVVVRDDGEGVIPEVERGDALRYIATHIGHSRKRNLTPAERREQVVAGKYGVGLLGFWAVGRCFEMRTRVAGSRVFALRLVEDREGGQIVALPTRVDAPATFTEVVVSDVHDSALRVLGGARLASYLGSELRGQLLARDVELMVHDGMARGLAQKRFEVRPRRFLGERLSVPEEVAVDGYAPVRVELYLARGDDQAAVQIACAGTVVADSVTDLAALGLDASPWVSRQLTGVLDFPEFDVPPGTRRGVAPNAAARGFVAAVERLAPLVDAELARFERERQAEIERGVARELRRALRGLGRRLPQYELPAVRRDGGPPDGASDVSLTPGASVSGDRGDESVPLVEAPQLFSPGPLASVRIEPDPVRIPSGGERRVRADVCDPEGRRITRSVGLGWGVDGRGFELRGEGPRPAVAASASTPEGTTGALRVVAREDGHEVSARADLQVVAPSESDDRLTGIPEPEYRSDPTGSWRSRLEGARWVVNDAHEDWIALRQDPRAKLRYLLALFAKEVVGRAYGQPGVGDLLERMVEVLAHAERNLRGT